MSHVLKGQETIFEPDDLVPVVIGTTLVEVIGLVMTMLCGGTKASKVVDSSPSKIVFTATKMTGCKPVEETKIVESLAISFTLRADRVFCSEVTVVGDSGRS